MSENINNLFDGAGFSVASLTDAINHVPFIPGRAGQVIEWEEEGIPTTSVLIDERQGELVLLNPTQRGGPGTTAGKDDSRTARSLIVPHYEYNDFINAEASQNVRAFGTASQLESLQDRLNTRLQTHVQLRHDPTLEYQRIGALKGVILNGNGNTLYNLFTEFGVTQAAEVDFDLDNPNPAAGALRKKCDEIDRVVATEMGGIPYRGLHAFCSDAFWDDLVNHPEVREVYLGSQTMALALLNPTAFGKATLPVGNIVFENYRGAVGATPFISTDACHIFPVGSPGLWRTVYAPADWEETVNTIGLPRYAKQYPTANGKGRHLDSQMNALSYCTRPKTLIKGKRA